MIEGLSYICDLLGLYKNLEDHYLYTHAAPMGPDIRYAIEKLYSAVFEYQIHTVGYLSKSSIQRGFRGTFKLTDWKDLLEKVQVSDQYCERFFSLSDRRRDQQFYESQSSRVLQSVDIQTCIAKALETFYVEARQSRLDDEEAKILQTLASDYRSDKDSISEKVAGTCEWFYEDAKFLQWRNSKESRVLWVSAGPGCGKSVLSRSLIDERRVCTDATTSTVC